VVLRTRHARPGATQLMPTENALTEAERRAVESAVDRLDTDDFEEERKAIASLLRIHDGLEKDNQVLSLRVKLIRESLADVPLYDPEDPKGPSCMDIGAVFAVLNHVRRILG
jgi:hypothetical protein